MKTIIQFIRDTLTGGILFLLPVVLLWIFLSKAKAILLHISAPIAKKLPEIMFGLDGSNLVAILLLILICFVSGLLYRSFRVKKWVGIVENKLLVYMPGYSLIKSITADIVGDQAEHNMNPILIQDGESWNFGFLVEEGGTYSTVFLPEAPKHDTGAIKMVPTSRVRKLDVNANIFAKSIKGYGKGAIHWANFKQPAISNKQ